jgi:hypothetical protein
MRVKEKEAPDRLFRTSNHKSSPPSVLKHAMFETQIAYHGAFIKFYFECAGKLSGAVRKTGGVSQQGRLLMRRIGGIKEKRKYC